MKSKEGFLKVTGGKIWYKIFEGNAQNIPLIVLHGGPGSASHSIQTINKLSKDRTVVFYDQLGGGKSDRPTDKKLWNRDRFVEELEALRDHLGFQEMYLLGHSWGSMLGVLYTLKYPKYVKGLVFSGPFLSTKMWITDTNTLKKTLPANLQEIIDTHEKDLTTDSKEYQNATQEFYKKYLCRIYPYPKPMQDGQKQMGVDVYNTMWGPTEFHCTGNLKDADYVDQLHKINVPVLLICGKYDMATPATTKFYKNKFPHAKMKILQKSAHTAYLEEPEAYIKTVKNFLKSL